MADQYTVFREQSVATLLTHLNHAVEPRIRFYHEGGKPMLQVVAKAVRVNPNVSAAPAYTTGADGLIYFDGIDDAFPCPGSPGC